MKGKSPLSKALRLAIIFAAMTASLASCAKASADPATTGTAKDSSSPVVTFTELGSVNCIPCKAMQPVMEEVRQKYGDQVSVVFHDVWTKEGEPFGKQYRIRVIPTQIFLDKEGKEYFRHEGFFPLSDLVKILEQGGVTL